MGEGGGLPGGGDVGSLGFQVEAIDVPRGPAGGGFHMGLIDHDAGCVVGGIQHQGLVLAALACRVDAQMLEGGKAVRVEGGARPRVVQAVGGHAAEPEVVPGVQQARM